MHANFFSHYEHDLCIFLQNLMLHFLGKERDVFSTMTLDFSDSEKTRAMVIDQEQVVWKLYKFLDLPLFFVGPHVCMIFDYSVEQS